MPFVEYATPRETLFVRDRLPGEPLQLLFYRGQGVSHDRGGRGYVTDVDGSRILVVGPRLKVERTVGGPSEVRGGLGLPLSAAPTPEGGVYVVDVEHPKGLVYFDSTGTLVGASRPPVANGNVAAGPGGGLWAARSPYILGFEATEPGDPLLYRFDPLAGEGVGIAQIEPTEAPTWNRLANAGSIAVGPTGTGYFAFLLRNEIRAYRSDGELVWRARRLVGFPTPPPTVESDEGEVRFDLRPVTQALSVGPDGLLYALVASDPPAGGLAGAASAAAEASRPEGGPEATRRVEVYDTDSGALLRASQVPAAWTTLAADAEGRVYRVDPDRVVASAPEGERASLPPAALVSFDGDTTTFAEYRGKALLVNLWASWCAPCRAELPQLKAYYATLDHRYVEFLGISEDTNEADARSFAEELKLPFPLFLGGGRMRDHFRYLGLPYTVIADYRGRIVAEFMGFGSQETWRQLTGTLEEEIARAGPSDAEEGLPGAHGEHTVHGGPAMNPDGAGHEAAASPPGPGG
ncbi:MAG: redoxin domain-containing protein [Gemmatimonadota bacterium]